MKLLVVCCLLLSTLCLRAELAFKWTVEVSQPLPYAAEALQGESFNLEAKVVQYRVPMLEAAEATFYYQTPEMEASQWYTVPAAWDATTATASVAFTPAMDVGSTKYRFFFGIETAQGKNYRVFGTLRLKASPGFSPATLTPTDVRAEIIQEILEAVFEEADDHYATKEEHAALAVQVQGKADASHTHADLQQSATVLLQAINSESESREEADAALEAALTEEVAAREAADVKLSAQVPVVRATLPNADNNANGYGYRGPLSRLGVYGEAVVIRRLAITTRPSGNQITTVPRWARVVRNVDGAWVVYAQAKEPRRWDDVTPGSELTWEMVPVPGVLPPSADEEVAIVWVNNPDAPATQSDGQVSWRTVSVSGGISFALPNVPTTSSAIQSWSPRIVLDFTAIATEPTSTFTEPVKIQNGQGTGSLWIGGNVNSGSLTNNQRHLARIVVPTFSDVTKGTTLLGFDSSGDDDMSVANKGYDAVSFGGMKKITNATSPMAIGFCVTKTRGAMSANDKVYPMEMDANEVRFNVRPTVNGAALLTVSNLPTMSMEGLSLSGQNGSTSFSFLSDGGVIFSTTSKGDTRSATLVGQAALAGKADAQHTHAFEEMAVTVSGVSYRWQWDETEGTFALIAE